MEFCPWKEFVVAVESGVCALGGAGCPRAMWVAGVLACHMGV